MALVKRTGDWDKMATLLTNAANPLVWQRASEKAIIKEVHRLRRIIVEAFNRGGPDGARWQRLSPMTNLVSRAYGKGDRKPLLDTGDLRNSIQVTQEGDGWFVGVHRNVKGKSGKKIIDIAELHENGAGPFRINVTDKMRKYFLWLNKKTGGQIKPLKLSTSFIVVKIPARPFIGPVWEKEKNNSEKNIISNTVKNLGIPMLSDII